MNDVTSASQEDITTLTKGMHAFPEDVFVQNQSWVSQYLLPLLSIDLGIVLPELAGTVVHMLNPTEPYDGLIGEGTEEYHNEYCGLNWLALKLTEDNKYEFLASENYFSSAPVHKEDDDDFVQHIKDMHSSYTQAKQHHAEHGELVYVYRGKNQPRAYLDRLGGQMWYGNWANTVEPPSAFSFTVEQGNDLPNDGLTLTHKGKEFIFVAEVAGHSWCKSGADAVLMFYEPISRIVLFTYDWS